MFTSSTASPFTARSAPSSSGPAPRRAADGSRPWSSEQARMLLAGRPENVRDTRRWLRAVMAEWAVSEDSAESAVLLLSELVGNAVLHARNTCRILVTARLRWGLLECEVEDQDPNRGPRHGWTPDTGIGEPAESGRGIPLLEALADAWGVRRHSRGKSVWFVLSTHPRPDAGAAVEAEPSRRSA
ncbi:ATP-binding protein [Streptomyces sp. NPDC047028]|uniref:ATP-binding protein n=1 Tax=Streptomyces sp. NPDC047028 TaxID=3155793 RepID=UPI0033C97364